VDDISADIQITRINGSLSRGGWECDFIALNDTDIVEVNQRIVVTWRGGFGGAPGITRTAFDGHVMPVRFEFTRGSSRAEFIAQTSDGILRRGWLQGIGFADTDTDPRDHYHQFDSVTWQPYGTDDYWYFCDEPRRMTTGRIVEHILGYYDDCGPPPDTNPDWVAHTNLVYHPTENPHGWITLDHVETRPFDEDTYPDGSMRVDRYIVRETDNLWSRLREIARNEFFEIYFDKTNTLYYTKHPMYRSTIPSPVMTFDEDFSLVPPIVESRAANRVRQVKLHAVTDEGNTLHAEIPASPTHVYGRVLDISRIRCNSQETLTTWARRRYYFENRDWTVRWRAPGLCGLLFDILDRVQITYSGTAENGVHIDWNQEKFWIHEINVTPDDHFGGSTEFLLEHESPCIDLADGYFC